MGCQPRRQRHLNLSGFRRGRRPAWNKAIEAAEAKDIVGRGLSRKSSARQQHRIPGGMARTSLRPLPRIQSGNHAPYSISAPQVVLSAPGTDIYSTGLNHAYAVGSGTSNSTAIIAGAAALIRSRFPKLSAVEVIHRLTATAIDKGTPGRDDQYGYGELNLVAALTANVPDNSSATTPATTATSPTPDPDADTADPRRPQRPTNE